jgi:hypothetical protein
MTDPKQHQTAVHEIANKIDHIIIDPTVRARFTKHIDKFCKMVEQYGQALQPYQEKLLKQLKKQPPGKFSPEVMELRARLSQPGGCEMSKEEKDVLLRELKQNEPLPPDGWIKTDYLNNAFVNVNMGVIYRPLEPVNPLLWLGIFGDASTQRKPTKNEKIMCEYVRLAIIHDYELRQPTDTPFFSTGYKGKWFRRDEFRDAVLTYYLYPNQAPDLRYHIATAQEKLSQLDRAFNRVKADLKPAETGGKVEGNKIMKTSKENWEAIRSEYDISKKDFGKKIKFVKGLFKRNVIFRDVEHAFVLASEGFSKPALILAGGVIEELLRLYLEHKRIKPKNKRFVDYIEACEDNDLLKRGVSRLSDSIRDFRNLVHLENEETKRHTVSKATAKGAVSSIFTIANDFQ